jgi:murein L,D-transpeptidase YafK
LFHGLIIRFLKQGFVALLVAAILGAPAVSWANGKLPWLLVDTQARTLTVFSAENRVLARFNNISIGSGGAAQIHRRGDETTPLGVFHVSWIDRRSRYDTFFGLDYPSEWIARRAYAEGIISQAEFDAIIVALQQHRTPPQNTPLGGRLGIHGIGRGDPGIQEAFNWTNGCVALTNPQIRRLSRWVHIGTRVVIR